MPGNIASFDKLDIIRCFFLLKEQHSRNSLKKKLKLGEGSIRSILDILKEKKLISPSNQGHILSNDGKELYDKIIKEIISHKSLTSEPFLKTYFPLFQNHIILCYQLPHYKKQVTDIYLLRDHAVRMGADGSLILEYKNGKLKFPGFDINDNFEIIENLFELEKIGLVLIVVAKDKITAHRGILNIVDHLTNIFQEFD